jgi:alcohol dehydrogenase (cytochrome c)
MDPDSGEIKFHFQYTPCDPYDYDGVNEVILADIAGKKVWLHGDRNGYLYSIDRTNGQCNWVVPLGTVDWNSGFGDNCTPIMDWPKMDVTYDKVTRVWPTLDGGKEWHPMSYSKNSGLVYVPTYNFYMDLQAGLMEWHSGEWYLGSSILRFGSGNGAVNAYDAASVRRQRRRLAASCQLAVDWSSLVVRMATFRQLMMRPVKLCGRSRLAVAFMATRLPLRLMVHSTF